MIHRNVKLHVSINEMACYQPERTLMGCADPPSPFKGVVAPHQCPRVNKIRSGWGKLLLAFAVSVRGCGVRDRKCLVLRAEAGEAFD